MRVTPWFASVACAAALGVCHKAPTSGPTAAASIPGAGAAQRTPGLWIEQVSSQHGQTVTRYCLDAATDGQVSYFGRQLNAQCQRRAITRDGDGAWVFSTVCGMGAAGAVTTQGVIRGDFVRHYVVEATTSGPGLAVADKVQADVRWQGACPADMKPGDVILPDGNRARLTDLAAG
ncbi:MAG: DUF3617 family protein [Caulobacterales bacterium]